ncbi:alkaline phosphatase PafA [Rufibacter ruber]|uniref:alkaline phosphatase PafA n=1 Tax=Rufibacter ruber TaxID=1783499 RepID=UPI00082F5910|nr:alkaline phosphatase PafA [Rufibacter ruber]
MKKFVVFFTLLLHLGYQATSAPKASKDKVDRPKLVVGIVIDQMRWDYLYRFNDRYGKDGFKRLLREGFSCENHYINYLPSATAVGHSSIYTGSVPGIHGITGNSWVDQLTGKTVYCTEDNTVQTVGSAAATEGQMSPRNMLASTITDELRIATNKQSKVVGVSLKDRASILPAGHMANGAFWFDDESGNFITSTFYMPTLPEWVQNFNKQQRAAEFMKQPWQTLYPINTYKNSDEDAKAYEGRLPSETTTTFPHNLPAAYAKKKDAFRTTPHGNTFILDFASAAVNGYSMGQGEATDFLTINCASTDYVGHMFGPNSIEIEDTYLRLDQDLAKFFKFLDSEVGKGQYLVFLTADHGVGHAIGYSQENKLNGGNWNSKPVQAELNKMLASTFGAENLVRSMSSYQVHFDWDQIAAKKLDIDLIKKAVIAKLQMEPEVMYAVDMGNANAHLVPFTIREQIANSYNPKRTGSIQILLKPGYVATTSKTGASHGAWNPYDTHLPLLFMGWNIKPGSTNMPTYMTDVAPTLAALLHIQTPNGTVGKPITAVVK